MRPLTIQQPYKVNGTAGLPLEEWLELTPLQQAVAHLEAMKATAQKWAGVKWRESLGVPATVIARANELLHNIEKGELNQYGQPVIAVSEKKRQNGRPSQLGLFAPQNDPVHMKLARIDPNQLSPLEALGLLFELKELHKE